MSNEAQRNAVTFDKNSGNIYSSFRHGERITEARHRVSNAKSGDKDKRLNDGNGLYLLIKPTGAK